ncbi:hypothetical protein BLBBGE_519 [Blattabacterium sp. (Blattella germanica) str. Bge]|uniref:DUF4293 family protein n=1 Tax=Blattabacterium sp. (Blattella germanica) TaxID=624186 RepID=UPI0001BB6242|nr:DUF4293 family protein [Blattabacterium sp. (Blattella germanica)]ACY40524.1 hypothetical protein BLBBGE_519 [Blattabacterium sp. (Blattella germanica) str. Bge]
MLYRIQTLYLFISILIYSISLYYFRFIFLTSNFFSLKKTIFIFLIIGFILSLLSLLFFKKKKLQIFMNKTNILAISTNLILFLYQFNQSILKEISLFFVSLCFCSMCVLYMANKAIKKDIELIDSMSRIR